MIEFMDEVVEAIEYFIMAVTDAAAGALVFVGKALIVITTPVWILPYKLIRIMQDNNGGECKNPDRKNCPFPPCKESETEND